MSILPGAKRARSGTRPPTATRRSSISPSNSASTAGTRGHLAFGFGAHVCLGQHLARLEMGILFRELLRRVDHIELNGEPLYTHSGFVAGLKSLRFATG